MSWKNTIRKKIEMQARIGRGPELATLLLLHQLVKKLSLRNLVGFKGLERDLAKVIEEGHQINQSCLECFFDMFYTICEANDIVIDLEDE